MSAACVLLDIANGDPAHPYKTNDAVTIANADVCVMIPHVPCYFK